MTYLHAGSVQPGAGLITRNVSAAPVSGTIEKIAQALYVSIEKLLK